jgi:hypothetical protein
LQGKGDQTRNSKIIHRKIFPDCHDGFAKSFIKIGQQQKKSLIPWRNHKSVDKDLEIPIVFHRTANKFHKIARKINRIAKKFYKTV